MTISDVMLQEFLHETQITKKLLERVPEDQLDWRPHEKSMTLGRLAYHISEIPQWADVIVNEDFLDMSALDYTPTLPTTRAEILDSFEKNIKRFKAVLEGKADEVLMGKWQLRQGEKVQFELPRAAVLRPFVLSHIIHHRGQLSVYLRENNVPLPAIYGPSADEQV